MESLYKRKVFASMRKTKAAESRKKRQVGLPASILDDSDEGSFGSNSTSSEGSESEFDGSGSESSAADGGESDAEGGSGSSTAGTSSDDSRAVARRKRSFLASDSSTSGDSDDEEEGDEPGVGVRRKGQPRKRTRLRRQDSDSDGDTAADGASVRDQKRRRVEEETAARRKQRQKKLMALSQRMKSRVPNRRRRVKEACDEESKSPDEDTCDKDGANASGTPVPGSSP